MKGAKATVTRNYNGVMLHDGVHSRFAFNASGVAMDRRLVRVPDAATVAGLRTQYPGSVKHPDNVGQVLISGTNNSKIGGVVAKGPWRGLPVFTLTLEERATCPTSCHLLWECYGNSLPFSRRHEHGPALEQSITREIRKHLATRPNGIVVRLHVLGDFYSADYVTFWLDLIRQHPRLRVFGYTAHPAESDVGRIIMAGNKEYPLRWIIRNSVRRDVPAATYQATTLWKGETSDGVVCPAETGKTAACVTCGLCWSDAMFDKRIIFLGHGNQVGPREKRI